MVRASCHLRVVFLPRSFVRSFLSRPLPSKLSFVFLAHLLRSFLSRPMPSKLSCGAAFWTGNLGFFMCFGALLVLVQ